MMLTSFLFVAIGILLLYFGGEGLVKGGVALGRSFGWSPLVIGLTVISLSTSMPEAVVSLVAQLQGNKGDMALGNVIGSNIANSALILGVAAVMQPQHCSSLICKREIPVMLFASLALVGAMMTGTIGRVIGIFFLCALALYLGFQFKQGRKENPEQERTPFTLHSLLYIVVGSLLLAGGGYLLIVGATQLARAFEVPERIIAITVLAIGTSLPELATSIIAVLRKHTDMVIGNVVGSNIFNIFFIIGSVSLILPISFSSELLVLDIPILLAFSAAMWVMALSHRSVSRLEGALLLLGYGAYMLYL